MQLGCRPSNLSLTCLVILVLMNITLTFLLLQSETCLPIIMPRDLGSNAITEWNLGTLIKEPQQEQQQSDCVTQDYQSLPVDATELKVNINLGRWDARRLFRTFDHILVGSSFVKLSRAYRVCLATQSSVEKLHSIVQAAHHWTGPMSVALYVAGDEEFEVLQKYLIYLRKCYEPIRERVAFSLAVPRVRPVKRQPREFDPPDMVDCAKPEGTLNELMNGISNEQTNWRIRNAYPQNHMRNLARKNCQSDYVFLTDVDIVPSFNLTGALDEFLRADTCDKCAYVIPTYELDSRVRFPQNKTELVRLARKGLARPFHQKVFIHNQFATNFTRWERFLFRSLFIYLLFFSIVCLMNKIVRTFVVRLDGYWIPLPIIKNMEIWRVARCTSVMTWRTLNSFTNRSTWQRISFRLTTKDLWVTDTPETLRYEFLTRILFFEGNENVEWVNNW